MADLKIPSLNNNSDKFLFKKKLSLRRKSKGILMKESFLMSSLSIFFIYLFYIIPNKLTIFDNFLNNLAKLIANISDSIAYMYEIFLAIFVVFSLIIAFILIVGVISRLMKITKRRSKEISFR